MVTSREPNKKSAFSRVEAKLNEGDRYIVDGTYTIEVEEINKLSKRYFAKIKISVNSCASDSDCVSSDDDDVGDDNGSNNTCAINTCSNKSFCITKQDCSKCNSKLIEVDVMTDNYPDETFWQIIDLDTDTNDNNSTNNSIYSNDPILYKFTQYKKSFCLTSGRRYNFIMNKSGKETLTENRAGYYALVVDGSIIQNDVLFPGTIDAKEFTV